MASEFGEVTTRLCMSRTHQNTSIHCLERKDVTGLHQITGLALRINGHLNRASTICSRDASGDPLSRLNGDGEGCAVDGTVSGGHGREL